MQNFSIKDITALDMLCIYGGVYGVCICCANQNTGSWALYRNNPGFFASIFGRLVQGDIITSDKCSDKGEIGISVILGIAAASAAIYMGKSLRK